MVIPVYGRVAGRNGLMVAEAQVDPQDEEKVGQYRWYLGGRKRKYVMACDSGGGTVLLHRLILDAQPNERIGHCDGDTLNNCRANLFLLE